MCVRRKKESTIKSIANLEQRENFVRFHLLVYVFETSNPHTRTPTHPSTHRLKGGYRGSSRFVVGTNEGKGKQYF